MKTSVTAFVCLVTVLAAASLGWLYAYQPHVDPSLLVGPAWYAAVAFLGTALSYRIQGSVFGSVSFIPSLTELVLYPYWPTVIMIACTSVVAEMIKPKTNIKRVFNVSQVIFSCCVASACYLMLGGIPLEIDSGFRLIPHVAAVTAFLMVNSLAVATVIGMVENKNIIRTWIGGNAAGLGYDVIAIPAVFAFARAYVDWGVWGVLALCTLLIGVKLTYQSTHQLRTTNKELLELFVRTVECRDPYTSGHSQRVSRNSRIIADILQLKPRHVERIATAALLHDVGKIHEIYSSILMKPGRLTDEERAIMETHPIKSAESVAKISDLQDIVPDVRHHHENWNGTGYPDKLVGEQIPVGSRIIMVADTIDAMLTDRPYRKALGPTEVMAELRRMKGVQFDPVICDALLNSPKFYRLFDNEEYGGRTVTQIFDRVRSRRRTPVAAQVRAPAAHAP